MPKTDIPVWQDRLGRGMMALAFVGALVAFTSALQTVFTASPATVWVETWRMFGFLVFAGMFALLALRPRRSPGLWELAFFHKAAMGGAALFLRGGRDAASAGGVDAVLTLMILLAYLLNRGWRSWLKARA